MTFTELNLAPTLQTTLNKLGYNTPTPIQQQAIPLVLQGRDVFGCAQTGTGKTAAFSLPILQLLSAAPQKPGNVKIKALVLVPTRELALQIAESVRAYGHNMNIRHTVIFGGISQGKQVENLRRGTNILIATPGRLIDLMQQGHVDLRHVEYFVLDEADRMLDMGFINDVKRVIAKLPAKKQTLFFSATAAPEILKLANSLLKDPAKISVTPVSSAPDLVQQSVYYVARENKRDLLKYIIQKQDIRHALVFTRTKRGADRVARDLSKNGIQAEAIHGDKSQGSRERALNGFKSRTLRVLVATDIASRGIDVDKLSHVINYELPEQAETYVHRIGRTGRAGNSGAALSLCTSDELPYLKDINKLIKKNIEVIKSHPFA